MGRVRDSLLDGRKFQALTWLTTMGGRFFPRMDVSPHAGVGKLEPIKEVP
jgi:hypothetical protein